MDDDFLPPELIEAFADLGLSAIINPPEPIKVLENLDRRMRAMTRQIRSVGKKRRNQNAYLRSIAVETGELAPGVEYWIVENTINASIRDIREKIAAGKLPEGFASTLMRMEGSLNGYVAFPKRAAPLKTRDMWVGGILAYIPVHGGVTYAVKDQTASVFGFDTQHYNSEHLPTGERLWIKWQCKVLYEGILAAAKIERAYLRAQTEEQKAEILQPLVDMIPEEEFGTAALINILSGEL